MDEQFTVVGMERNALGNDAGGSGSSVYSIYMGISSSLHIKIHPVSLMERMPSEALLGYQG